MATERNDDHAGQHGSIVFACDQAGCDETEDTGYTTWSYAKDAIKREGWYIMPDGKGGWDHLCPLHGKTRWMMKKRAEEAQQRAQAPS